MASVTIGYLESLLAGIDQDLRRRFRAVHAALLRTIDDGDLVLQNQIDLIRAGQIAVVQGDGGTVTIPDSSTYVEAGPESIWTVKPPVPLFNMSAGDGRLTYIGTTPVMAHIACTISLTTTGSNQQLRARLGISGVMDLVAQVSTVVNTGNDVVSTALHLVANLNPGDFISLFLRNSTSANDIDIESCNLQCMTKPMG